MNFDKTTTAETPLIRILKVVQNRHDTQVKMTF